MTPIALEHTPKPASRRTFFEIQAIVERPDGTLIRPVALIQNPQDVINDANGILRLVLKNYDDIENSKLIKAWLDETVVLTQTYSHEICI